MTNHPLPYIYSGPHCGLDSSHKVSVMQRSFPSHEIIMTTHPPPSVCTRGSLLDGTVQCNTNGHYGTWPSPALYAMTLPGQPWHITTDHGLLNPCCVEFILGNIKMFMKNIMAYVFMVFDNIYFMVCIALYQIWVRSTKLQHSTVKPPDDMVVILPNTHKRRPAQVFCEFIDWFVSRKCHCRARKT